MQLDAKALADATAEIVKTHVVAATAPLLKRIEALEQRPAPERGEKGDRGDAGDAGPAGRDGVSVRDAFLQREGVLVLTLTDGSTRELGMVVGKDGERGPPGETGPKGDPGEKGERGEPGTDGRDGTTGEKGLDGADGRDGKDGRDGFKLEDFDVAVLDDDRTIELSFQSGEHRHATTLKWPTVIDRGVFKADGETPYQAGDGVTWGGSYWIAQRETAAKPDTPDSGFRLAVKKGRDGKDAKAG